MRQIFARMPKDQRPKRRRSLPISATELRARELARLADYIPPSIPRLQSLTPAPFRNAIALMLERLGYQIVNDPTEGPHLIATKGSKKHIVFCARPADYEPTGTAAVGRLHDAVVANGADSGFYVSARDFTKEAYDYEKTAPVKLVDERHLKKSMDRSMRGLRLPVTYDAMCTQCGDVITHRLDKAKAIPCVMGHPVPPTIAMAALQPKEYPITKAKQRRGMSPKFMIKLMNQAMRER
jgi:Restriction endonuclease